MDPGSASAGAVAPSGLPGTTPLLLKQARSPSAARNDDQARTTKRGRLSERLRSRDTICPSVVCSFDPPQDRGRREDRVLVAPAVRVRKKSTRQNHRYEPKQPAFPARVGYGLYALSLGTGVLAPIARALVAPQAWHQHRDAGTTRLHRPRCAVRRRTDSSPRHHRVHRISSPTLVTIAKRPSSSGRDVRKCELDLPDATSGIFRANGLATAMRLMRRGKLVFCAQTARCPTDGATRFFCAPLCVEHHLQCRRHPGLLLLFRHLA